MGLFSSGRKASDEKMLVLISDAIRLNMSLGHSRGDFKEFSGIIDQISKEDIKKMLIDSAINSLTIKGRQQLKSLILKESELSESERKVHELISEIIIMNEGVKRYRFVNHHRSFFDVLKELEKELEKEVDMNKGIIAIEEKLKSIIENLEKEQK